MTNNWQSAQIKDFCKVLTGGTPRTNIKDYWNGDINWMSSGEVNKRRIDFVDKKITKKGLDNSNASILPKNTVMIALAGQGKTRGKVAILNIETTCNQSLAAMVVKDNTKLSPEYLFQYLESKYEELRNISGGEGRSGLNLYLINNFQIKIPDITSQLKIGSILFSLDEAIQKTDQIIQKSEELKSGLMNELLIKGIGHKKFKKTKLGEIPEEWDVKELSIIAKVERGKFSHRPRNDPRFYVGDIPFIQTGDVVNSKGRITKYTQTLNDQGLKVSKLFPKGTVVMTIAANIGDTGILEFDACFPDSLVGIQPYEGVSSLYLEYFLRTRKEYLNSIATQSAQKNINLEKLNPLAIAIPPIEEQKRIAEILSNIDTEIIFNKKDRDRLTKLKSGLMHDIFNQKVQIN